MINVGDFIVVDADATLVSAIWRVLAVKTP